MRLVVGLGNPGKEYEGTRHNVGFSVLDVMAANLGVSFSREAKWDAMVVKLPDCDLSLIKPMTFMNLSGEAVGEYARFYRIPPASVLVVLDDIALPLGTLRLRPEGGAGGQRGLESVLVHFATEQVPRLRVGIGGVAEGRDLCGHVLTRFSKDEQSSADHSVNRAAEAAICAVRKGITTAMNLYNATPATDKSQNNTATQP
jgi:PTH1 family peptidyl-tRNA hydrolase